MGQYYRPVTEFNNKVTVYNRYVDGEYTLAKLMEHSWIGSRLCSCVAEKFYHKKGRLAWVGDYADETNLMTDNGKSIGIKNIWKRKGRGLKYKGFGIEHKYILNHTKHLCIDVDKYVEKAKSTGNYIIFPLSLLTALGNGRGGGDYHDCYPNFDKVGSWAWDEISIEDEPMYDNYNIVFKEETEKKKVYLKRRNSMTRTLGSYKLSSKLAVDKERRMIIRALYNFAYFHEVKANSKGALFFRVLANVWELKLNKAGNIEDIFLYGTVLDASRNQGVRW